MMLSTCSLMFFKPKCTSATLKQPLLSFVAAMRLASSQAVSTPACGLHGDLLYFVRVQLARPFASPLSKRPLRESWSADNSAQKQEQLSYNSNYADMQKSSLMPNNPAHARPRSSLALPSHPCLASRDSLRRAAEIRSLSPPSSRLSRVSWPASRRGAATLETRICRCTSFPAFKDSHHTRSLVWATSRLDESRCESYAVVGALALVDGCRRQMHRQPLLSGMHARRGARSRKGSDLGFRRMRAASHRQEDAGDACVMYSYLASAPCAHTT